MRWGRFGAAGVLFVHVDDDGPRVLVQQRSPWSHEGGTWSVPGGAIDLGESPAEAAIREADEEIGPVPADLHLVGEHVFAPATDWTYTTVVVAVPQRFGVTRNFESDAVAWLHPDEVEDRELHDGFAAAWPHLRRIVDAAVGG